jgi:hypothetical protein
MAVARVRREHRAAPLGVETSAMLRRIASSLPAPVVTLAGVHGGAGVTTLCLLLAEAVAAASEQPVLAVDLAGRSRGGLAVLGGAAGRTTVEGTSAVAAIHGGAVDQPFGINEQGLRIVGAPPDGVEELDRSHETLVARLVEAVGGGADDTRLAELARSATCEDRCWQALRWDNEQVVIAVAQLLDQAVAHHALVAVDMGMLDSPQLATVAECRSQLHVWVLPSRATSLEIAERRLPLIPFEPAGDEAIAVWAAEGAMPSAKRLSALGDLRGCPVVRVANYGDPRGGPMTKVRRCLSGVTELCELAR